MARRGGGDVVELRWEVGDGYVGKSRPQKTQIHSSECEGMTREEIEEHVEQCMQDDFDQKITAEASNLREVVDTIYNAVGAEDEEGEEE